MLSGSYKVIYFQISRGLRSGILKALKKTSRSSIAVVDNHSLRLVLHGQAGILLSLAT